jgi:hypothetical protein
MASFVVTCPCCQGRLTIDPAVEAVVSHEPPPPVRSGLDLGGAVSALKGAAAKRDAAFDDSLKSQGKRGKVLDAMFKEGLKKAKESPDEKPVNPFDLD